MVSIAATRPPDPLRGGLWFSGFFHAVIIGLMIYSGYIHRGDLWGGPGGAISVGLVGSVPAIPLPRNEIETPNRVVDESRGLYKSEPAPEIPAPEPAALPIPKFKLAKPVPKYKTRPSKVLENPATPPPNAIPYGRGGTPTIPATSFAMGAGATQGGMAMGGAGGGDFGSKFPWYVQAVQQRISQSWLQSTVDPRITWAPRVVATFDILRDGTITNAQITQSSGNSSVDTSALRAVQSASPLTRLPGEYSGTRVSVEFWFDFRRQ
jgi:protein TonB